jgi:hypothetical protein
MAMVEDHGNGVERLDDGLEDHGDEVEDLQRELPHTEAR